jgi:hypothetical protein
MHDALYDSVDRVVPEWRVARAECIHHDAETEQIGLSVARFAADLLRGHVLWSASDQSASRRAHVAGDPREAEIRDAGALGTLVQQDVFRLDIAMDQSLPMRSRQRTGDLQADSDDRNDFAPPLGIPPPFERPAGQILHDEIGKPGVTIDAIDEYDVFVRDRGRGARLARESFARRGDGCGGRIEDLDCHDSVQRAIPPLEHQSEPAAAKYSLDFIGANAADHLRIIRRAQERERRDGSRWREEFGGIRCFRRATRSAGKCQQFTNCLPVVLIAGCRL